MNRTLDLGARIELLSMDNHCHDITLALYKRMVDNVPIYRVHTYSRLSESKQRVGQIVQTMKLLGGMSSASNNELYFPCKKKHELAVRRLFLECCKYKQGEEPAPLPLQITDKKTGGEISVKCIGSGYYKVQTPKQVNGIDRRVTVIARGLIRLGEMNEISEDPNSVQFPCEQAHDALVGILLLRAPNVRAAIREAEELAGRGQLAAPSAQQ